MQMLEGAIERKAISDGHGTEVIHHHFYSRTRLIVADRQTYSFLDETERSGAVFEILWNLGLMSEATAFTLGGDPTADSLQINCPPNIIGKYRIADSLVDNKGRCGRSLHKRSFGRFTQRVVEINLCTRLPCEGNPSLPPSSH